MNIGFYFLTVLETNLAVSSYSISPINLGAQLMVVNESNSESAFKLKTKVRRIMSEKPTVTLRPYESLNPTFS